MCVTFFALDAFPGIRFVLAFNRDEFFARPTSAAHFWPEHPDLLGGRDEQGRGTWLGVTRAGRIAFLTNLREKVATSAHLAGSPSRGALITDFLLGSQSPQRYLQALPSEQYSGFNLVVGDLPAGQLAYLHNTLASSPPPPPPSSSRDVSAAAAAASTHDGTLAAASARQGSATPSDLPEGLSDHHHHSKGAAASPGAAPHGESPPADWKGAELGAAMPEVPPRQAASPGASSIKTAPSEAPSLAAASRDAPLPAAVPPAAVPPAAVPPAAVPPAAASPIASSGGTAVPPGAPCPAAASPAASFAVSGEPDAVTDELMLVPVQPGAVLPQALTPGTVYGLSNGLLMQWPKVVDGVERLKATMAGSVDGAVPWDAIFDDLMGDRQRVEALRPAGGGPVAVVRDDAEAEYMCSPRFLEPFDMMQMGMYGTRSQTVLVVFDDGRAELRERVLDTDTLTWGPQVSHQFTIPGLIAGSK